MIKAGFGSVEITPPIGCALQGYFLPRVSEKIHDPLFANAMVVDNGNQRICLVSCDLICVNKEVVQEARTIVKGKTGIEEDKIIICGTHTHTGPVVDDEDPVLPGWENSRDLKWLSILPHYISSAVIQATKSMSETGVACMSGYEDKVSFNRRYLMKDGTVKTNPDIGAPDIVKPAGPIDPEVGVLAFGEGFSKISGVIVNFALHLDNIGGNYISADFPGVMKKTIKTILGEPAGFIYTSGAMGNINHRDVTRDKAKTYEYFEHASRIGRILGSEVLKTVSRMENFSRDIKIGGTKITVRLPLKEYNDESLAKARRAVFAEGSLHNLEYLSGLAILRASTLGKGEVTTEMAAIRIGDTAFVSIPGEYFVELGLYIKKHSPFHRTFIVELGLDSFGYIAHKEAYAQEGYEPVSSPIACGAGEIIADTAIKLLESLI